MTEVRFQPEPTFEAPVHIHVPGKGEQPMLWTFKYRDVDEVVAFQKKWARPIDKAAPAGKKPKARDREFDGIAYIMDLACGWQLEEEFSRENLETFFKHYPTSVGKVVAVYFAELSGVRLKN